MHCTTKESYFHPDITEEFVRYVRGGGVFIFPTETVYGIGANALDDAACARIFTIKGRPQDNPLIVHVHDAGKIAEYARINSDIECRLIEAFMPGPLTIILPAIPEKISKTACAGLSTVAVRVPDHPLARGILSVLDLPIAAPSANPSGRPSATSAGMARAYFENSVPYIFDGWACDTGIESTIVRVDGDTVRILRPGSIAHEDIEWVLPDCRVEYANASDEKITAPGMKYRHYAPNVRVCIISADEAPPEIPVRSHIALLATEQYLAAFHDTLKTRTEIHPFVWWDRDDPRLLAKVLYETYTRVDWGEYDILLIEDIGEKTGLARAIMNRVRKSAER